MYDYISGAVADKADGYAVIDAGGIGYRIYVNAGDMTTLGESAKLYVYEHITETSHELYGFTSKAQRTAFTQLLTVKGVGVKVALNILSVASPYDIAVAIINNNTALLQGAPGIGAKTAARIILELKDKFKRTDMPASTADGGAVSVVSDVLGEAVNALVCLGYSAEVATEAVKDIPPDVTVEQAVRIALRKML